MEEEEVSITWSSIASADVLPREKERRSELILPSIVGQICQVSKYSSFRRAFCCSVTSLLSRRFRTKIINTMSK